MRAEPLTLVSPTIVRPDGQVWFDGIDLDVDRGEMRSRRSAGPAPPRVEEWLVGTCLMLSKTLWERVGGFDERYFLYWEDVDFSRRVAASGGGLRVDPVAIAVHQEGGSQQAHVQDNPRARAKSLNYYYYNVRNRLLYAAIHLDTPDQVRWRRSAIRAAYRILLQGGRRQFVHPLPPLRAAAAGVIDGRRILRNPESAHAGGPRR